MIRRVSSLPTGVRGSFCLKYPLPATIYAVQKMSGSTSTLSNALGTGSLGRTTKHSEAVERTDFERFLIETFAPVMEISEKDFEKKCLKWTPEDYKETLHVGEATEDLLPFIDRDDEVSKILKHLETRWNKKDLSDKRTNPLIGVHSVPGGGKSYLLDKLASLDLSSSTREYKCL